MLSKLISEAILPQDFLIFIHLALFLEHKYNQGSVFFGAGWCLVFMLLRKVALKSIKDQFDGKKMFEKTLISIHALRYIDNNTTA